MNKSTGSYSSRLSKGGDYKPSWVGHSCPTILIFSEPTTNWGAPSLSRSLRQGGAFDFRTRFGRVDRGCPISRLLCEKWGCSPSSEFKG
jgi:hypothetical protein